jgi:hypothetical protein
VTEDFKGLDLNHQDLLTAPLMGYHCPTPWICSTPLQS